MAVKVADIREALSKHNGNVTASARALKITRQSLWERIQKNEGLQDHLHQTREVRVDKAEDKLDEAIERGEGWAIAMTLKTLGKDRGYVEKTEQQTTGDLTIRVEYDDDVRSQDT